MLKGKPFPKLHAKAAETKAMLAPVSAFLQENIDNGKQESGEVVRTMVQLLDWSHTIDTLVDSMSGYAVDEAQGQATRGCYPLLQQHSDQTLPLFPSAGPLFV